MAPAISGLARRWSAETIAIEPAEDVAAKILDREPGQDARAVRYSTGLTFAPLTILPR